MSANNQLTHLPLQAIRPNLLSIATALRVGVGNHGDDIIDLRPDTACRNAVAVIRYASPALEQSILLLAPFAILSYGIYHYVWKGLNLSKVIKYIRSRFVSSVTVPAKYALHEQVLAWMANNGVGVDSRSVTVHWIASPAAAAAPAPPTSTYSSREFNPFQFSGHTRPSPYDFADAAAGVPVVSKGSSLSYIPSPGSTAFTFNGHSLWVQRKTPTESEVVDSSGRRVKGKTKAQEADITISCYSMFAGLTPIQEFLEHVAAINEVKFESQIRIHRLSKYVSEGETWDPKPISRPIRKLDSVSMEEHRKQGLIDDIKTYLSPESKTWYANRGIPWRRGYLFYGPPGTGKTSFCTALAGHFGLELYILPLSSPHLNDAILEACFDSLPPRCLVLVEDVDSAGIGRETAAKPEKKKKKSKKTGILQIGRAPRSTVTLAGLLNTIDGPVSHEGRVLVMTSNSPDHLDPALLRPGRIDRKVLFGNASSEVVEKLFMHIYAEAPQESTDVEEAPKHDLPDLAKQFARSIPEDQLTPAEIQNYLLESREDPKSAVENAQSWAEGVLRTKSLGLNVENFQGQIGEDDVEKINGQEANGLPDALKSIFGANGGTSGSKNVNGVNGYSGMNGVSSSWVNVNGHAKEGTDEAGEDANGLGEENGAESEGHEEDGIQDEDGEGGSGDEEDSDEEAEERLRQTAIAHRRANRVANRRYAQMRRELNLSLSPFDI